MNVDSEALMNHIILVLPMVNSYQYSPKYFFLYTGKERNKSETISESLPITTEMILITNSSVGRLFWQMYLQLGKITNEPIPYSRVDTGSAYWICSQKKNPGQQYIWHSARGICHVIDMFSLHCPHHPDSRSFIFQRNCSPN